MLNITYRPLADLIPYARNSRTHSDGQVAQIAASIKEFGFTNPVLVDADGGIIAGHGRVLAARKLALADVPCIALGHLTPAQRKAYVDVAVKRWQAFTGKAATLEGDGRTFDAVASDRVPTEVE